MPWQSFVQEFRNIYVCRLFPDSWDRAGLASSWRAPLTGGPSSERNPQFKLSVSRATACFISVAKDKFDATVQHHAFSLFRGEARLNPAAMRVSDLVASSGPYSNQRLCVCEAHLEPGSYVLVPSTYTPGQAGAFAITVNAEFAIKLAELPAE